MGGQPVGAGAGRDIGAGTGGRPGGRCGCRHGRRAAAAPVLGQGRWRLPCHLWRVHRAPEMEGGGVALHAETEEGEGEPLH